MKNFKKLFLVAMAMASTTLMACNKGSATVLVPSGSTALGLANYLSSCDTDSYAISTTGDALTAAFNNEEYDVIVAPINLGAKMYSVNKHYVMYKTFTWGNLFLASTKNISSLSDLAGKKLTVFNQNNVPDIVMRTLITGNNISDVTYDYVAGVDESKSALVTGTSDYCLVAEPVLSKLKVMGKTFYTLDLQDEWQKLTGKTSYPQAAIFANAAKKNKLTNTLKSISESIQYAIDNKEETARKAVALSDTFATIGEAALSSAIPGCNFDVSKTHAEEKEAIEYFFGKMADLELSAAFGGAMPNEEFYY